MCLCNLRQLTNETDNYHQRPSLLQRLMGAVRDGHADEQRFDRMGPNGQPAPVPVTVAAAREAERQGSLRSNASADSTTRRGFGSFFRRRHHHQHPHRIPDHHIDLEQAQRHHLESQVGNCSNKQKTHKVNSYLEVL